MTTLATSTIAREDAKVEVKRFLEYCRQRQAYHAAEVQKRKMRKPKVTKSTQEPKPAPENKAAYPPTIRAGRRHGESLTEILTWLRENQPATANQIAGATKMRSKAVNTIIRRNPQLFEVVAILEDHDIGKPPKLWRLVEDDRR